MFKTENYRILIQQITGQVAIYTIYDRKSGNAIAQLKCNEDSEYGNACILYYLIDTDKYEIAFKEIMNGYKEYVKLSCIFNLLETPNQDIPLLKEMGAKQYPYPADWTVFSSCPKENIVQL